MCLVCVLCVSCVCLVCVLCVLCVCVYVCVCFSGTLPDPVAGVIESGLTLHAAESSFHSIHLDLHGFNGQLPNMDLVLVPKFTAAVPVTAGHEVRLVSLHALEP